MSSSADVEVDDSHDQLERSHDLTLAQIDNTWGNR
jgi:hypothetical protein